ncbi:MAG: hemolysin III family protein [Chloroflexota bacterium]
MTETHRKNWLDQFGMFVREPVNGLTHGIAALLALIGMIWLIWMARDMPGRVAALAVFGTSMVLLYTASSVMHFWNGSVTVQYRLNQLDHAAIYLLIAGSYTPFTYTFLEGWWTWGMLSSVWVIAAIGVTLKLGFNMYGHISTLFYVLMGWIAIIGAPAFFQSDYANAMWWIIAGGVTYTVGAVIFAMRRPNFHRHFGHHELWHLFVIGGSACHFVAAAVWVASGA